VSCWTHPDHLLVKLHACITHLSEVGQHQSLFTVDTHMYLHGCIHSYACTKLPIMHPCMHIRSCVSHSGTKYIHSSIRVDLYSTYGSGIHLHTLTYIHTYMHVYMYVHARTLYIRTYMPLHDEHICAANYQMASITGSQVGGYASRVFSIF